MTISGAGTWRATSNGMFAYNTNPLTIDVAVTELHNNIQSTARWFFFTS